MTIAEFTVPPLVKTVTVRVQPARAFAVFVGEMARWWPLAQFHTGPDPVDCMIEPRIGGRVYERAADGRETVWGTVTAYEPPSHLAFSWLIGLSAEQAQLIDLRFTPQGEGTLVALTHTGWEKLGEAGVVLRERYGQGWATIIERCYAEYANTNPT